MITLSVDNSTLESLSKLAFREGLWAAFQGDRRGQDLLNESAALDVWLECQCSDDLVAVSFERLQTLLDDPWTPEGYSVPILEEAQRAFLQWVELEAQELLIWTLLDRIKSQ